MSFTALSGQDTLILNNYIFTGLGDANYAELTFPNEIASIKTGKNGNSIFGFNESGKQCELKIRVLRGSSDDKFLNNLLSQQQANFAGTVLLQGQYIKKIGDGQAGITADTYVLSNGVFVKIPEAKSNAEGDVEQSLAIWMIKFTLAPRVLT